MGSRGGPQNEEFAHNGGPFWWYVTGDPQELIHLIRHCCETFPQIGLSQSLPGKQRRVCLVSGCWGVGGGKCCLSAAAQLSFVAPPHVASVGRFLDDEFPLGPPCQRGRVPRR